MNSLSLSDVISSGNPQQVTIYLSNKQDSYSAIIVSLYRIKYTYFVSLSTTTQIISYITPMPSSIIDLGSFVIKSIDIDPYIRYTIRKGSRSPYSLYRTTLILIQVSQALTTSVTFLFIPGNAQYCYTRSRVFLIPRYPLKTNSYSSLIKLFYQSSRIKAFP